MDYPMPFAGLTESWLDGVRRTLGTLQRELGASLRDPPPVTPYDVIHESGKLSLRHYRSAGRACSTPIILVYALVKRPFVLDLEPGRSVVENLTSQGFEVFLTDWLPPAPTDSWRGFEAYVDQDLANAVRAVQLCTGTERVTIIGYCLGSLLGVIYAALYPETTRNLVTLTLPLELRAREFQAFRPIDWFDEPTVKSLTAFYGNFPAWLLSAFFSSATTLQRVLNRSAGLKRFSERERYTTVPAFRRWLDSEVPIAGTLFRELTLDIWGKNSLARGGFRVGRKVVDLRRITSPVLNVVADFDLVVDPRACLPLIELVGSADASTLRFPTSHTGVALSEEAHARLWPEVGKWLRERDN